MRLAEALIERADAQKKFNELKSRMSSCVVVQEGEEPSEKPLEILTDIRSVLSRMEYLVRCINKINSQTAFDDAMSISDAIAHRDRLKSEHEFYSSIANQASNAGISRYSRTEIRTITTINVSDYRDKADKVASEFRTIDTKLQEMNWKTELIEG